MATNQQSQRRRKDVEDAATAILAYLDMEQPQQVEYLLNTLDRHTLGLVTSTWYAMCVVHKGFETTGTTAAKTAEYLQQLGESKTLAEKDGASDSHAAALLFALVEGKMDKFAKTWQETIDHQPDITADVAARLLGFTRGILGKGDTK